jgi:hypothetical protein
MQKRLALVFGMAAMVGLLSSPSVVLAEENGIKIGEGRLHPFLNLEGRFDSAAQLRSEGTTFSGDPDFIIHVRPGIRLNIPSPLLDVDLNAELEYLIYTGFTDASARKLDRLQAGAGLQLNILKNNVVSVQIGDQFRRSSDTTVVGPTVGLLSLFNDANIGVTVAPGGGGLTIQPAYHLILENFSPLLGQTVSPTGTPSGSTFDAGTLNYITHLITLTNRWRFLPKTAVLLDGEFGIRQYGSAAVASSANQNINFFKAYTGITGLLSTHISVLGKVGFGMDITTSSFLSVVGQLEGVYLFNETSSVRLGLSRDFQPLSAPFVSFDDNKGYLGARVLLFEKLALAGQFAADYLNYTPTSGASRADLLFTLDVSANLEVFSWMTLKVGDTLTNRSTSLAVAADAARGGIALTADQVYVQVEFIY